MAEPLWPRGPKAIEMQQGILPSCDKEWRGALVADRFHVGAGIAEQLHDLHVVARCRRMKRGIPIFGSCLDIRACGQQQADATQVVVLRNPLTTGLKESFASEV